jgi:hypothetical protein
MYAVAVGCGVQSSAQPFPAAPQFSLLQGASHQPSSAFALIPNHVIHIRRCAVVLTYARFHKKSESRDKMTARKLWFVAHLVLIVLFASKVPKSLLSRDLIDLTQMARLLPLDLYALPLEYFHLHKISCVCCTFEKASCLQTIYYRRKRCYNAVIVLLS